MALDFTGYTVSIATTQCCSHSAKQPQTNNGICVGALQSNFTYKNSPQETAFGGGLSSPHLKSCQSTIPHISAKQFEIEVQSLSPFLKLFKNSN